MQNSAWVALLRHIPAERHNQYSLVTSGGTEIAIQSLLLIEQEFVALKGRLAGSQDAGRVFFVPYAQIDYFGTLQPIKDSEFHEQFDTLQLPGSGREAEAPVAPPAEVPPAAERAEGGPRPTIRSEVLERYRKRPSSSSILPNPKANST